MDLWWIDYYQKEYFYDPHPDWVPQSQIWLNFFYFFGWICSFYAFYTYFIKAPNSAMHPMTMVALTEKEWKEAEEMQQKRKEFEASQ